MKGKSVFTLAIVVLMAVMLAGSFAYRGSEAFIFPFYVSLTVLVMGILLWLHEVWKFPFLEKLFAEPEAGGAGVPPEKAATTGAAGGTNAHEAQAREVNWKGIMLVYAFLVGFLALSYLTSYLVAVPVFLFSLMWLVAKEEWRISAAVTVGTGTSVYLVFEVILNAPF